ncbi:MAG: type IX secretion system sortase PorU, partial [Saprospiraceae bacterium]
YSTIPTQSKVSRNGPTNTFESVLATGEIYKIAVQKTGIHKLDFAFLENKLGIKTINIDPKKIQIFGNGGGPLPVRNGAFRQDDLMENAIFVSGQEDGKFDNTDYVLFYAEGPDKWTYDSLSNSYLFSKNIYADFNYYFLKINQEDGLRIQNLPNVEEVPELTLSTFESVQRYEEDKINLLGANPGTTGSGKEWYGDYFKGTREMDYTSKFDLTNIELGQTTDCKATFVGRASQPSNVQFLFGDKTYSAYLSNVNTNDSEATYASKANLNQKTVFLQSNPKIVVKYPAISVESEGWLDFIEMIVPKKIVLLQDQYTFRHRQTRSVQIAAFDMDGYTNQVVWDISMPGNPFFVNVKNNAVTFKTEGTVKEFISHRNLTSAFEPVSGEKIANQNLHQHDQIDMLIVYHPDFEASAKELQQHRSSYSKLQVVTASIFEVYNEFSSGKTDPVAIRDLSKMLYQRNPNFQYLLLLGDGSYDYKGLMPNLNRENFIPVYETDQSLNPITGFPADDFYGLLDEDEGSDLFGGLDISVGRLPAKSQAEASVMVKKIIHYDTHPNVLGDWRLRTGYAADDEDSGRHIFDTDEIARKSVTNFPVFNQQKVYFDAFPQVSTAGDPRYPEATQSLNSNIFAGQLSLTYLGHGGPQGWAQERVLTLKDIKGWTNYDKLFLMITATCSFAAYDDPKIVSPGEETILNAKGGAVALYSTTRAVYTNSNKELTDAVHKLMFQKVDGVAPTFGQILKDSKNKNSSEFTIENSRKFTLLGDPSQQIALPKENIVITAINQKPFSQNTDTLKAMTFVEIQGQVEDKNNQLLVDFNGTLSTTFYDKKNKLRTLQNDVRSPLFEFDLYQNIIFKGKTSVKNGKFSFGFWIPKDINYNIGNGRISMYASDGISKDASGYSNDILVGGSTKNGIVDDTPPNVDIYMNDESFVQGGITDENPVLLIKLQDDFGINVTGNAVGHDITSILNDNSSSATVLNDFFEAQTDDFRSGTVQYPLKNLSSGKHTIRVKAWDIANNSAEKETDFLVVDSQREFLERVLNYPNPFSTQTNFAFEHDLSNTTLDIHVYIYSVSGKLVKIVEHTSYYTGNRVSDVKWNGKDDFEDRLARGVYLYKIKIHAKELNLTRESKFEKLVIL